MKVSAQIDIRAPREAVWSAITNIGDAATMITSISSIEVLEKPSQGVVGLKWKETRKVFGTDATETMWITDAEDNEYYRTRAESHGCVYVSQMSLSDVDGGTQLTFSFSGKATSIVSKIMSFCMSWFLVKSMKKELDKDLLDIKQYMEQSDKHC